MFCYSTFFPTRGIRERTAQKKLKDKQFNRKLGHNALQPVTLLLDEPFSRHDQELRGKPRMQVFAHAVKT